MTDHRPSPGDATERFAAERPTYEAFAGWVAERLGRLASQAGVYQPTISARAKALDSFAKKAIRESYVDPWVEITDKAGARLVVGLLDDVAMIDRAIQNEFVVLERDDKGASLPDDRFKYLGLHFLVTPREEDLDEGNRRFIGLMCEVQVHTRAQNAWAMVSHPLTYKGLAGPVNVARRINRLLALVELFDSEVASARRLIMDEPGHREASMLQTLEREFFPLAGRDFDQQLSLHLLELLADSYKQDELERFSELITSFLDAGGRDHLRNVFSRERDNNLASPLLYQPETILILERLNNSKARLRAAWNTKYEERLLQRLSETLGRPL
jgi:ppGpp synthetase/RelA/SpoT-type nucleotidyltranferase